MTQIHTQAVYSLVIKRKMRSAARGEKTHDRLYRAYASGAYKRKVKLRKFKSGAEWAQHMKTEYGIDVNALPRRVLQRSHKAYSKKPVTLPKLKFMEGDEP